jgi:hypothetical protein
VAPRPIELRPYRIAVYAAFGVVCAVVFFQLIRSVVSDLYGRSAFADSAGTPSSPTACLEDLDRLYHELAARAMQPAPRGLDQGLLAREWDLWSRRWEAEVEGASRRCHFSGSQEPAMSDLSTALEALEDLRRVLSRSGEQSSEEARRVRDSLTAAREKLNLH